MIFIRWLFLHHDFFHGNMRCPDTTIGFFLLELARIFKEESAVDWVAQCTMKGSGKAFLTLDFWSMKFNYCDLTMHDLKVMAHKIISSAHLTPLHLHGVISLGLAFCHKTKRKEVPRLVLARSYFWSLFFMYYVGTHLFREISNKWAPPSELNEICDSL